MQYLQAAEAPPAHHLDAKDEGNLAASPFLLGPAEKAASFLSPTVAFSPILDEDSWQAAEGVLPGGGATVKNVRRLRRIFVGPRNGLPTSGFGGPTNIFWGGT